MGEIHSAMYKMGLVRSSKGRILGGVCAGLAEKLGADIWAVRVLVIAGMVVIPGSPIVLYPIFWALMPDEDFRPDASKGAVGSSGSYGSISGQAGSAGPRFGENPQYRPRDEGPQDEIRG